MEALAFVLVAEASVGAIGRNAGEAQMGGSLAPTALGYSIECSFLRQKQKRLRTQMPPGRPPTVPKKS